MTVNDKLGIIFKKTVVINVKGLAQHLLGASEENFGRPVRITGLRIENRNQ
jgi:hypothetical protein